MPLRMRDAASRIHADLPVVDGHNDLPYKTRFEPGEAPHTDLPRLLAGGVGLQFWSVFVPAWTADPFGATLGQIELVEELAAASPDLTALATTAGDAEAIRRSGRMAGMLGAEGGHCIDRSLTNLRELAARGVRYMTLTHGSSIEWADSATDEPRHGGLTAFGREVVAVMNQLGMLVDVSHVSAATMRDALAVSEAPVVATHSNARALADHPRNLPDDVLEGIAASGGVACATFVPAFLVPATARQARDMFEQDRRLRAQFGPAEEAAFLAARRAQLAGMVIDRGTVADVADHVEHMARVAGVDHVGLGGDFDGVETLPAGLEDVSCYPAITTELLGRGWPEDDVRKVLGDNWRRVLATVAP